MSYFKIKIIKKLTLSILISLLCLTACNTVKTIAILKKGKVAQKKFEVKIPFEYRLGLIVLKVSIAGNKYDFILDTGASNLVSKTLAEKLELDVISDGQINDS